MANRAEFDVPDGNYAQLDLVVTSGDGQTPLVVTLEYSDDTQTVLFSTVPDWFDDPVGLTACNSIAQGDASLYYVQDGMDRVNGLSDTYESANDPAIFGLRFPVNPAKELQTLYVVKNDPSTSVLVVLGGALSHTAIPGAGAGSALAPDASVALNQPASLAAPLAPTAADAALAVYERPVVSKARIRSAQRFTRFLPSRGTDDMAELLLLDRYQDHYHLHRANAVQPSNRDDDTTQPEFELTDAWDTPGNSLCILSLP